VLFDLERHNAYSPAPHKKDLAQKKKPMPPSQPTQLNWTAIGIVVVAVINIAGWFVVHFLTKRREAEKDQRTRDEAETAAKKGQDAATADWRCDFRGVAVELRTEMERTQSPSDWFPIFDAAIPILNRAVSSMPVGVDSLSRSEIVSIVDELTSMSAGDGAQAVYSAQKIVDMLRRLEDLTKDT
jgi:hypothetical protein